jgi:MFS family permease
MISWGLITILTGSVRTAGEFYTARFFLGLAEASVFPGMIVYLTHWFRLRERSRAIACLYAAVPTASLIGAPIAGWLLSVHWRWLAGWRWLFILEGIPAIVLGIVTIFFNGLAFAGTLAVSRGTRLAYQGIASRARSEEKYSRPHHPRGVLRPAGFVVDGRLVFGARGCYREHLLDTDLC